MTLLYIIIGIIIGAVAGIAIGTLMGKAKLSTLATQLDMLTQETEQQKQKLTEQATELTVASNKLTETIRERDRFEVMLQSAQSAHAEALQSQEQRHKEAIDAMQQRFNETIEKTTAQMRNATETMLKDRQKEFAESSTQNLGQIVTPLRETIERMKKAMDDSTIKQTAMSSEMKANIENMMRQSQAAKESADELARVFKHGSKVQGDWGETVLDELLQSQGLTNGVHYDTQATIRDASGNTIRSEEGALMRPDVILHLDQRRELIIDSKVSLTAFIDYVNAENEEDRQRYLKAHVESIQKHVKELSQKDYSSYIQSPKVRMDYVIMFVPHSGALWTALNMQPDLWRKAMDKNVFIADEQTLYAAMRIINMTWTQIVQAQNHEKVYALANEMLNRVGQFWKVYVKIGSALTNATKAYDDAKKKITDGGQSINTTANQLIQLGAKENKSNPLPLEEKSEE